MNGIILCALLTASDPQATVSVLRAQYAYAHETRPALPDSFAPGVSLELNRDAVTSALAQPQRELIVYSQPFEQCPPCRSLFEAIGEGDGRLKLTWVKSNLPAWVIATPTVYDPVQHQFRVGQVTLAELKRWTGVSDSTMAAASPAMMGAVHGRVTLDTALDAIAQHLGETNTLRLEQGRTIPLGSLQLVLPSPTVLKWDLRGPTRQLTFDGQQPILRAWGLQVACEGISYDGTMLTIRIPRFPDWKLRVEP